MSVCVLKPYYLEKGVREIPFRGAVQFQDRKELRAENGKIQKDIIRNRCRNRKNRDR